MEFIYTFSLFLLFLPCNVHYAVVAPHPGSQVDLRMLSHGFDIHTVAILQEFAADGLLRPKRALFLLEAQAGGK